MKRSSTIVIAVVVVLIVLVGGYAALHKSNKATTSNSMTKNSAPAVNNTVFKTMSNSSVGQYLAASNGMALYTYGGDTSGVSNVSGSLLANWPAYQDTGSTTNLPSRVSTIKRTDNGETQYTYNGMPLYFFTADSAGQVTGNGVNNFSVAKPGASTPSSGSSAAPTTNSSSSSSYYQ